MDTERAPFLRITEIFHSIQGESTRAGLPCTFVRLTGCPLRCVWCDTEYAFTGGTRMTLDEIVEKVDAVGTPLVEITGGEPLAHPNAFPLAARLADAGYTVLVETSGAFDISGLDPRVIRIMDLKCPGSGESARNLWSNLDHLGPADEVKFVVADRADYEWARGVIRERGLDRAVVEGRLGALLFSPVWEAVDLEDLAAWILDDRLPARFQLQLHKLIWGADTIGV
ncbi:7-carboxy-7-deazaguanine synthase QueE [Gaopeijia maritima]|uniref:7-carboxy-7-deazaguanine synthase QueE n=1 Tax=Gaopeijia maritima TaxID=3119007 RepID=UPI003251925D